MQLERRYSLFDKLCLSFDQALRALSDGVKTTGATYPASHIQEEQLSESQKKQSEALMRINHTGEICAQALYHSQGLVSHTPQLHAKMQQASIEEGDHLAWCKKRLDELGGRTSYLNPFWYMGSFCIGVFAGRMGDAWSLGFVAETEQQVVKHLEGHLDLLKSKDPKSYAVLQHMEKDEAKHRDEAMQAGAKHLPFVIKKIMAVTSKIMVKTAYYV